MSNTGADSSHDLPGGLPRLLGLMTGLQALATLAALTLATIAPEVAADLGVGTQLIGYQVSLVYLAAAAISCLAGNLVQRWGAGTVCQVAVVMIGAGCLALAAGYLAMVAVGSLLLGIGYALTNPAASHLLYRFTPAHRRNIVFSLKQTGVPIGGVVAGLMLPTVAERAGWQVAILIVAGIALAQLAALLPVRASWNIDRQPGGELHGGLLAGPRLVWQLPALRSLAITGFCFSALQLSLMTFAVTLLVEDLGWALVAAGATVSVMQVCGALGRVLWGAVADRVGNGTKVLFGIGTASTVGAIVAAGLTPAWPAAAVVVLLGILGACVIGWNGVFLAQVARASPKGSVGLATGGALVFTFVGIVIGPSLFSGLYSLIGNYALTLGAMAGFTAVGSALLLLDLVRNRNV